MHGPWINGSAVLTGGFLGAAFGERIPKSMRNALTQVFGLSSMGLGIAITVQVKHLAVMVLALIAGAVIGEIILFEKRITNACERLRGLADRLLPRAPDTELSEAAYLQLFVAVLVLFCASGTGVFGAIKEGMTGDPSILVAKSLLDFCSALIFGAQLGYAVAAIALPLVLVQVLLVSGATLIVPFTTPLLVADFTAVGGLIMLATGFRICGMRHFSVANMLPALFIAMPLSALWTRLFHV